MSSSKEIIHALNLALGAEPARLKKTLERFGSAEAAWENTPHAGIDPQKEFEKLATGGIGLTLPEDQDYPRLLKEIFNPPALLYIKGRFPPPDTWHIGIVGTRKPTEYGKMAARQFAETLAGQGAVIVSGCAYGIDREAHIGALAGGVTVAVIGSGHDYESFHPRANWQLAEAIAAKGGAVISEYPPGAPALPYHFPERNRIIAGMVEGLIIVEAREKSGAHITARLALESNRDVFAVPGSIFSPASRLPNRLIQEGAMPALGAEDIIEFYGRTVPAPKPDAGVAEDDAGETNALLNRLAQPTSLETLKIETGLSVGELQAEISRFELAGKIFEIEPGLYQKTSRGA